jgi:hypothetical protein
MIVSYIASYPKFVHSASAVTAVWLILCHPKCLSVRCMYFHFGLTFHLLEHTELLKKGTPKIYKIHQYIKYHMDIGGTTF